MQAASPVVHDGQTYDRLSVNLAVTTSYNAAGERDMSIAMRVIPTRIDAEIGAVTLDSHAHTVYRGRLAELKTPDEQACVQQMTQALQALIESKGW
jgi:hypothetical protein